MSQLDFFNPPPEPCPRCGYIAGGALTPLDEKPLSHTHGPSTEKAAALRAWPKAGSQRLAVLKAIAYSGRTGRTFDELVQMANNGEPMYSAQKRLHDLKDGGWVVESGDTRPTRTGAQAGVYILSDRALDYIHKRRVAELHDQQADA